MKKDLESSLQFDLIAIDCLTTLVYVIAIKTTQIFLSTVK